MWTYIVRRLLLMIPTLFGVTIVSFCIMQLAPGDPLLMQLGASGAAGTSSQTREAYLIQKRDLKLDKPLLLNFNYFRDYSEEVRIAAHYLSLETSEIRRELAALVDPPPNSNEARRLAFLVRITRQRDVNDFEKRLADPAQHGRLAEAVKGYVQIFAEDAGQYAVPAVMDLLEEADLDPRLRIGAIRELNLMVFDSFVYTYSRNPDESETVAVVATWRTWWERAKDSGDFAPVEPERLTAMRETVASLAAEPKTVMFQRVQSEFFAGDVPYLVEVLLDEESPLDHKVVTSIGLLSQVGRPLKNDVALDAPPDLVNEVTDNWRLYFKPRAEEFSPSLGVKLWRIVADTQYAHMVWRLATFNFGRSALRTREPVSEKIWNAVKVSAPLMLLSQLLIYFVAVPAGVVCAVNRGNWVDRLVSLKLFALYSIPPYVAGMLFLLLLCYGENGVFPMQGLHDQGASVQWDRGDYGAYLLDYLHHIALPVTCLSLFGLAGLAMYSRSSMLDAIGQDYIRTARAKGLSRPKVILKHALRNSLIPIITLFSNLLPAMLGGSVLVEYLFNIPGMGRLSWNSILQKDFPTLMALIYIDAIVVMVSILLTDLLYVVVDPRISFEGRGKSA